MEDFNATQLNPVQSVREAGGPHRRLWIAGGIVAAVVIAALGYAWFSGASRASQNEREFSASVEAFNRNDLDGAVVYADNILARDPANVSALLVKATALEQKGSLMFEEEKFGTQAILVAQQALAIDPKSDEAWRIIGYANEIMEKYDAAHAAYEKAIELNPKNAAAISQDAHAWDLQGNAVKAEAEYRAALSIDATLDQAQMGLARIDTQNGKSDEALALFSALSVNAKNARHRAEGAYSAGVLAGARGDTAASLSFMRTATTQDPSYALGWAGLGAVLFSEAFETPTKRTLAERNDLITQSFTALERAILINPNQSSAYLQLGAELATVGKKDAALKILGEASRVVADDITLTAPEKTAMSAKINAAIKVIKK